MRCWISFILILVGLTSQAHDLGVVRVELRESPDGNLTFLARVPQTMVYSLKAPDFAEDCSVVEYSRTAAGYVRYVVRCDRIAGTTIRLNWDREGAMVTGYWRNGDESTMYFPAEDQQILIDLDRMSTDAGFWYTAQRFTLMGIEHILLGLDHLLFVLGLLFIVRTGSMLVKTITAFTISHSLTLGLAVLGVLDVPAAVVDVIVALSIVFVGAEILHNRDGNNTLAAKYPWIVAFVFGLVHGLGFAGALNELGLPSGSIIPALFSFNIGVEIGQLIFVFAFLALRWAYRVLEVRWPAWAPKVPAYAIGIAATVWFFERLVNLLGL